MKRALILAASVGCTGALLTCAGCGGSGNEREPLTRGDPVAQTQASGAITPGSGGTVSTTELSITFPPGAVDRPMQVILQGLLLDPYRTGIPGIPGRLVKVCRVRPEYFRLRNSRTATLTYRTRRSLQPGAQVTVFRQERTLRLVGGATENGDEYSVEIDRLGIYFWVVESNFCLRFDGQDDHVSVPYDPSISFNTSDPFTIEFWFRTSEAPSGDCVYRVFVGTWDGGAVGVPYPYEARLWLGSSCWAEGSVTLIVFDGSSPASYDLVRSMGPWNDGRWHHYAAVRDGTKVMRIFVDGRLEASKTPDPARGPIRNWRPVTIGGDPLNWHILDGWMDEVRIWNAVRDRFEIRNNMHKRLAGTETGLAALWNFDEGGGGIVHDSSPNANDAIVVGDPQWLEARWAVSP